MTEVTDRLWGALGDRQTLERELGRGRMATVFLSRIESTTDLSLQRSYIPSSPLHTARSDSPRNSTDQFINNAPEDMASGLS